MKPKNTINTLIGRQNILGKTLKTRCENMDRQSRETLIFKLYFIDIQLFTIATSKIRNHFCTSTVIRIRTSEQTMRHHFSTI